MATPLLQLQLEFERHHLKYVAFVHRQFIVSLLDGLKPTSCFFLRPTTLSSYSLLLGSVVRPVPCLRWVAGSNPLHATYGPWGKSFTCSCLLRFGVLTPTQCSCSSRKRLWVVVDLKSRCRNTRNE